MRHIPKYVWKQKKTEINTETLKAYQIADTKCEKTTVQDQKV